MVFSRRHVFLPRNGRHYRSLQKVDVLSLTTEQPAVAAVRLHVVVDIDDEKVANRLAIHAISWTHSGALQERKRSAFVLASSNCKKELRRQAAQPAAQRAARAGDSPWVYLQSPRSVPPNSPAAQPAAQRFCIYLAQPALLCSPKASCLAHCAAACNAVCTASFTPA